MAPGPSGKPVQRREGDPDKTETFKEEEEGQQHRTVDGHEGSHSAHTLNITSGTGSTPLTSTEGRTYYTHSQRSKRKSVARKRPCRQNSLTSCSQKAAQVPEPRMETTPRGECLASIPPGGAQVNTAKPTTTGDEEDSTSCLDAMNSRNEASLKGLNVIASQEDKKRNLPRVSLFRAVRYRLTKTGKKKVFLHSPSPRSVKYRGGWESVGGRHGRWTHVANTWSRLTFPTAACWNSGSFFSHPMTWMGNLWGLSTSRWGVNWIVTAMYNTWDKILWPGLQASRFPSWVWRRWAVFCSIRWRANVRELFSLHPTWKRPNQHAVSLYSGILPNFKSIWNYRWKRKMYWRRHWVTTFGKSWNYIWSNLKILVIN